MQQFTSDHLKWRCSIKLKNWTVYFYMTQYVILYDFQLLIVSIQGNMTLGEKAITQKYTVRFIRHQNSNFLTLCQIRKLVKQMLFSKMKDMAYISFEGQQVPLVSPIFCCLEYLPLNLSQTAFVQQGQLAIFH